MLEFKDKSAWKESDELAAIHALPLVLATNERSPGEPRDDCQVALDAFAHLETAEHAEGHLM
jgi:hypothetical protein